MPLCTPRQLRPAEIRVMYLLEKVSLGSRAVIAQRAEVSEKAINRVMTSLKDMKLIAYDAEGSFTYALTLRGKCALVERYRSCCQPRHRLITRGVLKGAFSGTPAVYEKTGEEWVDEPCGTPLFGEQIKLGKCKGCCTGWTHEHSTALTFNDDRPEV